MAAIDYSGIEDAIKAILEGDSRTSDARVYVEEEPQFGLADAQKAISITLESRSAPAGDQSLSAGKRTRFEGKISVWSHFFTMESFRACCTGRDALLGAVDLVLMDNRTISGKARTSWIEGGRFFSARASDGMNNVFVASAETVLVFEATAINT